MKRMGGQKAPLTLRYLTLTSSQELRLAQKIQRRQRGCWLWTGPVNAGGYGYMTVGRKMRLSVAADGRRYKRYGVTRLVHRVVYRMAFGPLPKGLVLDHVYKRGCQNKRCVRPSHLQPVTPSVNRARYTSLSDTCKWGHPLKGTNLRWYQGARHCNECNSRRSRELLARRRAERVKT